MSRGMNGAPGSQRRRLVAAACGALLVGTLLAGCGQTTRAGQPLIGAEPKATQTSAETARATTGTAAPDSTATATPTASFVSPYSGLPPVNPLDVCMANDGARLTETNTAFATFGGIREGVRLPDSLAPQPQVVTATVEQSETPISLTSSAELGVTFAAPTDATGYICGVTAKIVAFTPIATPVPNVTWPCHDDEYLVPGGFEGTQDCGAAPLPPALGEITFTSATVGATAESSVIDRYLGMPAQPGQVTANGSLGPSVFVGITVPQAGAYTFSLSLWQDRSGPSIALPQMSKTFAAGQIGHEWGGWQCTTAQMQAELPPAPPAGQPALHVICPGAYQP